MLEMMCSTKYVYITVWGPEEICVCAHDCLSFFLEKDLSNVLGIYFKCPVYSEGKSIESLVKSSSKGKA